MTRQAFLSEYRRLIVDGYGKTNQWANDAEKVDHMFGLVEKTLTGNHGIPWAWDGAVSRTAFRNIGCKGPFTLKALRALPVAAQPVASHDDPRHLARCHRRDGGMTAVATDERDDAPYCDAGCGDRATVQLADVGYCDDCAANALRESVRALAGKCCCNVWRQRNGFIAVCLAPFGVEHDHS